MARGEFIMMNDLVKVYIDKFAKIRDRVLADAIEDLDISADVQVPQLRTVLKSTSLNGFFESVTHGILVLYALLYDKATTMLLMRKATYNRIEILRRRVDYLKSKISNTISYIGKTFQLNYEYLYKTTLFDGIILNHKQGGVISAEHIENVDFDLYPMTDKQDVFPFNTDEKDILTDENRDSEHLEKAIYTDTSCGFILDQTPYVGVLGKLTIEFTSAQIIRNISMKTLPGFHKLIRIKTYSTDGTNVADITLNKQFTDTLQYTMPEEYSANISKIELYVHSPYPTINQGKYTTTAADLLDLVDAIPMSLLNAKDIKNNITALADRDQDYKYRYRIGIYYIKFINSTYVSHGYALSKAIDTKYIPNAGIGLNVQEKKSNDTSIVHILENDIRNYIIVPNTINGQFNKSSDVADSSSDFRFQQPYETDEYINTRRKSTAYEFDYPDFIQNLDTINPNGGIVTLSSISKNVTLSNSAKDGIYDLGAVPISVISVKYRSPAGQTITFAQAKTLDEFFEEDDRYYIFNTVILANKTFLQGNFIIQALLPPKQIRIRSYLFTRDQNETPILISGNLEIVGGAATGGSLDV
jgi:hypothetical protein